MAVIVLYAGHNRLYHRVVFSPALFRDLSLDHDLYHVLYPCLWSYPYPSLDLYLYLYRDLDLCDDHGGSHFGMKKVANFGPFLQVRSVVTPIERTADRRGATIAESVYELPLSFSVVFEFTFPLSIV